MSSKFMRCCPTDNAQKLLAVKGFLMAYLRLQPVEILWFCTKASDENLSEVVYFLRIPLSPETPCRHKFSLCVSGLSYFHKAAFLSTTGVIVTQQKSVLLLCLEVLNTDANDISRTPHANLKHSSSVSKAVSYGTWNEDWQGLTANQLHSKSF